MSLTTEEMMEGSNSEAAGLGPLDVLTSPRAVERRVLRNTLALIAIALAVAMPLFELRITLGLAVGAFLGLLNFRWLLSSIRAALSAGAHKAPPGTTMKFLFRWLVVLTAAFIATRTAYVDAAGLAVGLFAPAVAIMIEAGYVCLKSAAPLDGEK